MKKTMIFVVLVSFLAFTVGLPQASVLAADGTQSVNYQVNQPNSSSASIANDYFLKPAKVTTKNGVSTVKITLKNSAWITKFQPPGGATLISEDKASDKRVVQFTVKDLSKPVKVAMKVDVNDINYHHEYTVDMVFDEVKAVVKPSTNSTPSTTPPASSTTTVDKTTTASSSATSGTTEEQVTNPQTGDSTPYLLLLALVGSAFLLYRTKLQTKQGEH